jgi:ribosomal protein S12 methylthiotransferase
MEQCQAMSARKLKDKVGLRMPVIVDRAGPRAAEGRSKGDAPEIDGAVHISSKRPLRVGDIVTVKIDRSDAYDLYGTAV